MADKAISDLTAATQITLADLFVLEQNNTAKKLTGLTLMRDLATALDGHGGINSIVYTAPVAPSLTGTLTIILADTTSYTVSIENGNGVASITRYWAISDVNDDAPSVWHTTLQTMTATYRYLWSYTNITFDDGTDLDTTPQVIGVYGDKGDSWFVHIKYAGAYPTQDSDIGDTPDEFVGIYSGPSATAPIAYTAYKWYGWKGPRGYTGNAIASVTKTGTSGLVDTYTVTFTDGNTSTFTVTNGSNISAITKTGISGLQDTYTVTLTNGQTTTFTVNNGKSIASIAWASTTSPSGVPHVAGATDTYVITYNDNDTSSFQVYNGANGSGTVAKVDGISSVGDNVPLLTIANGPPTTATAGSVKSRYFDALNSILYICVAYDSGTGTYTWQGAGVTVDSALSTSSTNPVQNKIITGKVGTSALNTTAQNLSDAVNELDAEIGDVSQMTTTATDLAGAVNELDGDIGSLSTTVTALGTDKVDKESLIASGTDLNTITTSGFYRTQDNLTNKPTGASDWSQLIVSCGLAGNSGTVAQIYIDYTNGNTYVRSYGSNTWTSWKRLETVGNAVAKSGDTMTGSLELKSSNVTSGSTTEAYGNVHLNLDGVDGQSNPVNFGYLQPITGSGGQGIQFAATRSGVYHGVSLYIDSNGNCSAFFNQPQAWLDGLGFDIKKETDFSSWVSPATGYSLGTVALRLYGKVLQWSVAVERTGTAITTEGNTQVFTLSSALKPLLNTSFLSNNADFLYGTVNTSGTASARVTTWAKNTTKTFRGMHIIA